MPNDNTRPTLLPHHREQLHASGLTDTSIAQAGFYSIGDPAEAARLLNWKGENGPAPAIAFPVYGLDGTVVQTVLRPDAPRVREDGSVAKYEQPLEQHHRVYFPLLIARDRFLDSTVSLCFTEGIKKGLAIVQAGGVALSMQGVSTWHDVEHREKTNEWRLHPDLLALPRKGRTVFIVFDGGDTSENPPVILAEARLALMLLDAEADVLLVRVPFTPGGPKVGIDDFLAKLPAAERPAALERLQAEAIPADPLTRVELALSAEDSGRHVLALLKDPSFAASLRVADAGVEEVARKRLRSVGVLRKAVFEAQERFSTQLGSTGESPRPAGLLFDDPQPAKEPQVTAALLLELRDMFDRYVALPVGAAVVLALWTMATWALDAGEFSARLALTSPTKRCGKTRVLGLLMLVCRRALVTANISAAALFRAVEAARPTLLIDEADSYLAEAEELRGVLNAGYRYDGAVLRCVGDDHEPTKFSCYAPAAIAAIGALPGTLSDRSITLQMERKARTQRVARIDRAARKGISVLPPRLARWADDHLDALREARPAMPETFNDREAEISEPLLAIADLAGPTWGAEARTALCKLFGAAQGDASDRSERLLGAVWSLFSSAAESTSEPAEFLSLKGIVEALLADETGGWDTAAKGRPITAGHVSRWLGTFGLTTRREPRDGPGSRPRGYHREDLAPVATRYARAEKAPGENGGPADQAGEAAQPADGSTRKHNGFKSWSAGPPSEGGGSLPAHVPSHVKQVDLPLSKAPAADAGVDL